MTIFDPTMCSSNNDWSPANAAVLLEAKQLAYRSVPRRPIEERRSFEKAWSELQSILRSTVSLSAQNAATKLRVPFTASFDKEVAFDQALFDALKECFNLRKSTDIDEAFMLLERDSKMGSDLEHGKEYAVGLARQKPVARALYPAHAAESTALLTQSSANGMTNDSWPDHAVCLFEKHEGAIQWEILDCFAIMELKTSETACADFEPDVYKSGYVLEPKLARGHRSLGQALLYNLGCVLPFHARRGTLGTYLPIATLAGRKTAVSSKSEAEETEHASLEPCEEECHKLPDAPPRASQQVTTIATRTRYDGSRKHQINEVEKKEAKKPKKKKKKGKLRWVSASIAIPEACGGKFTYSVHDFDNFHDNDAEVRSIEQAMVVYVDTCAFGVKSALDVLGEIERDEKLSPPKPASGQFLFVGDRNLEWELCASPIHGANPVHNELDKHWKVSQGELFTGTLNVGRALADDETTEFVTFLDGTENGPTDEKVLIKVSSRAVHYHLVDPFSAYTALEKILFRTEKNAGSNQQSEEFVLLREIRSVLYAAISMDAGVVTIMADLSKQGYGILSPLEHPGKLSTLWDGFCNLVRNVLLPLAQMRLVHADIRPGNDETSNILCKIEGVGTSERAVLKLIDYESLVEFARWNAPSNGSYIETVSGGWTATTFVWWQCLAVAYAWKTQLPAASFFGVKKPLVLRIKRLLRSWLPNFQRYASENAISKDVVLQTLLEIARVFQKQGET